jgi:hypothetical protein
MPEERAPGEPAARQPGWYRDRSTGKRQFWNGSAWLDVPSAVTPFTFDPEPADTQIAPVPVARRWIDTRGKRIGAAITAGVVIVACVVILVVSHARTQSLPSNFTAPSDSLPSDAATVPPVSTTSSLPVSTTTAPSIAVVGTPGTTPAAATSAVKSPAVKSHAVPSAPVTSPPKADASGNVALIGDSIFELAGRDLERAPAHDNLYIDAVGGTTMSEHLAKIEQVASDGKSWDWVIELGTNDALASNGNWASDFANEVAAVRAQPCVVFVTVNPRLGPVSTDIDQAISNAVASHSNFHTLDWGDIEFQDAKWLLSDGIHPSQSGAVELAKLVHKAVRGCQGG